MSKSLFRSAFSEPVRVSVSFSGIGRTDQSFQKQCDINQIMVKYQKTGLIDHVSQHGGNYGDFTSASDYHTAMNQINEAQAAFDSLPSSLRKRFDNDPYEFLKFVQEESNIDEMRELGLIQDEISSGRDVAIEKSIKTNQKVDSQTDKSENTPA